MKTNPTINLKEMTALVRALVAAQKEVNCADEALKKAKEKARKLREETIPLAMQEIGVLELQLTTGETISIKQEIIAELSKDRWPPVFDWLDQHGFGGIIKTAVITEFSRGQKDNAIALLGKLHDMGIDAGMEQGVHMGTMKAFLREQLRKGADVPLDLFGAKSVWTTVVK